MSLFHWKRPMLSMYSDDYLQALGAQFLHCMPPSNFSSSATWSTGYAWRPHDGPCWPKLLRTNSIGGSFKVVDKRRYDRNSDIKQRAYKSWAINCRGKFVELKEPFDG